MRSICFILAGLLVAATGCDNGRKAVSESQPALKALPDFDEEMLKEAGVGTDNDSLLAFLRKRSASDADLLGMERLVRQLGSKHFNEREDAGRRLVNLGLVALPSLRQAVKDPDPEISRRASLCIHAVTNDTQWHLPRSAMRLLFRRKPKELVDVLLTFLPSAADDETIEETIYLLYAAVPNEAPLPLALLNAITDRLPIRRAAAACIVGKKGGRDTQKKLLLLLNDPHPEVRLRAAQGLLASKDAGGTDTLIQLLTDSSMEIAWQAQELLSWAANGAVNTPAMDPGSPEQRRRIQRAWEDWWKTNSTGIDFPSLLKTNRRPGLILVSDLDITKADKSNQAGRLRIYGSDGNPRWHLNVSVRKAGHMQLLKDNKVLLAEENATRLTERHLSGELVHDFSFARGPLVAFQRLPNGNTFIGTTKTLQELGTDGKVTYHYDDATDRDSLRLEEIEYLGPSSILCTSIERDSIILVDTGKPQQLRRLKLPECAKRNITIQRAPPSLLTSQTNFNRVVAIDLYGREIGKLSVSRPRLAVQQRNNNLLCVRRFGRFSAVSEIDICGRTISESFVDRAVLWAKPCLQLVRLGFNDLPSTGPDLGDPAYRLPRIREASAAARTMILEDLKQVSALPDSLIPHVIEILGDDDLSIQQLAKEILIELRVRAISPSIAALEKSSSSKVRRSAALVLGVFREHAETIWPHLITALRDSDERVRADAATALGNLGVANNQILTALSDTARKDQMHVRRNAIEALGHLGSPAAATIPILLAALREPGMELRISVVNALGRIGSKDKQVVAALVSVLKDESDVRSQIASAYSLGAIRADDDRAIQILTDMLSPTETLSEELRIAAARSIGRIGPSAIRAAPTLVRSLKNDKESTALRCFAVEALGMIRAKDAETIEAMRDALKDSDPQLRTIADEVLKVIIQK